MCIYCDLFKGGKEAGMARFSAQDIIDTCQEIAGGYKAVLSGHIKPHSDEMTRLVQKERHLVRNIIQDIL